MNLTCHRIQALLAEGGLAAIRGDAESLRHGVECTACFELFIAFDELDRTLDDLPVIDAPDRLVDALELRIAAETAARNERALERGEHAEAGRDRRRGFGISAYGGGAAAALLLVIAGGLYVSGDLRESLRTVTRLPPGQRTQETTPPATPPAEVSRPPIDAADTSASLTPRPSPRPGHDRPGQSQDTEDAWLSRPGERRDEGFVPQGPTGLDAPADPPAEIAVEAPPRPTTPAERRPAPPPPPPHPAQVPEPSKENATAPDGSSGIAPASTSSPWARGLSVKIVDESGDALPGATVTISHENGLVKPYTVLTDRTGGARFPVLKAGGGYVVEAGMASFVTRREVGIRVPVDGEGSVVLQLAGEMTERVRAVASSDVADLQRTSASTVFSEEFIQELPVPGRFYQNVLTMAPGVNDPDADGNANVHGSRSRDYKAVIGGVSDVDPLTGQFMSLVNSDAIEEFEVITGSAGVEFGRAQGGFARIIQSHRAGAASGARNDRRDAAAARAFMEQRARIDGVPVLPARGHWLNRYVPGDPTLRLLQARLAEPVGAKPGSTDGTPPALHRQTRRVQQPFDTPRDGALSVNLRSDRRGIDGRGRALLQVGIQAARHHGGRRPALNLAVVLDLGGETATATAAGMRSLLTALAGAKDVGDRFSLTVAGLDRPVTVTPEAFGHGVLSVGLADWLESAARQQDGRGYAVSDALRDAIERVGWTDDPSNPIGSSAVILITGRSLAASMDRLVGLAHHAAVAGIPVSVVGVGQELDSGELETLTLAGHGSLRLLVETSDAAALVDRELSAAGRAVARALRVSIRLAPGVQLIDVIGSRPLQSLETERVRRAERSIDQRLFRNLGIAPDRNEDDAGIQLVIPTFYAGDSHVILLDVVATGGRLAADVEVRFKDLVRASNNVTRDSLAFDDGESPAGPLQVNVLRNLLALRFAETLEDAGSRLRRGDTAGAAETLRNCRSVLRGMATLVPELAGDANLTADGDILSAYLVAVEQAASSPGDTLAALGDSLTYAGLLKLLPRPVL